MSQRSKVAQGQAPARETMTQLVQRVGRVTHEREYVSDSDIAKREVYVSQELTGSFVNWYTRVFKAEFGSAMRKTRRRR